MNFKEETVKAIEDAGHTIDDIAWIGSYSIEIPIKQFFEVAEKTVYDNGWGIVEIPLDLLVVFRDKGYLKRREYDGSEWWQYIAPLKRPQLKARLAVNAFTDPTDNFFGDTVLSDYIYKGVKHD